jgi:hypothetical protein
MMSRMIIICTLLLLVGCNNEPREVIDSPFEPIRYKDERAQSISHQKEMIDFLFEAERAIQAPFKSSRIINGNIEAFPAKFTRREQLVQYVEKYLNRDLAHQWVEEAVNTQRSRPGKYIAIEKEVEHLSIFDADPGTIKIIQNSTLLTTVEMFVTRGNQRFRLQYVIERDQRGEDPKILQKLIQS